MTITLNTIIENVSSTDYPTLGGRSHFNVTNSNGVVSITNSRGTTRILDDEIVSSVSRRYEELLRTNDGRHLKASQYTDPHWQNGANRIFSPYVARIVSELA